MENLRYEPGDAETFGRGIQEAVEHEAGQLVTELDLGRFADQDGYVEVDVAIPFSLRIGTDSDLARPRICCIRYPNGDVWGSCCPEDMEED